MTTLRLHPIRDSGQIQSITPQTVRSACPNWTYVGFEVHRLRAGETLGQATGSLEHLLVLVTGKIVAMADGKDLGELGGRMDIFTKEKAHALYVPNDMSWTIRATTDVEIAVCMAPGMSGHEVRIITPDPAPMEERGKGANTRFVNAIMMEERDWADSLLVTEVWTPNGNWSSYPSHKHDTDDFPNETHLEETYYHRIDPPNGFAIQRVYNDDQSLDETIAVSNGDVVLVPEGYHPCGAVYGFDLYYLNVMAGPRRNWRFTNDPDCDWIFKRDTKA
ncbi:MAG: 5-deoxy-glucuronate isomerase [Pseudomonadota bacterium]